MTEISMQLPMPVEKSPIGPARHMETTGKPVPELRYIRKALTLLKPEKNADGSKLRWQDLHTEVQPWNSSHELTDNVRESVVNWVLAKIPELKANVHSFAEITDKSLTEAMVHAWYDELKDSTGEPIDISGQRREALLATMSHVVRKIETGMFLNILQGATPEQLGKLGLVDSTRDLTMKLMTTSLRADPLFIRYMAYAGETGSPSDLASAEGLLLPGNDRPHTVRELFPKETKSIGSQFVHIAEEAGDWVTEPGGETFKKYLEISSRYYAETDPQKATQLRTESYALYTQYLSEGFPVVLTGPTDESVKPPYIDPELKVSLRTQDAKVEEEKWKRMQDGFVKSLALLGLQDQSKFVADQLVIGSMVLGGYGANLYFDAVAQENPTIQIFLNNQARAYDREFPKDILEKYIQSASETFGGLENPDARNFAEFISRSVTIKHELGHWVFPEGSPEDIRFGDGAINRTMQEVKAETLYRALIPTMIESGYLQGTKEQWAQGLVGTSIQLLRGSAGNEHDDYFLGAALTMNDSFSSGAVAIEEGKVVVKDADAFFNSATNVAREVVGQYRGETSNERTAKTWVKSRCTPSKQTRQLLSLIAGS